MKLSKEDIQFIDTYLENSDVVFADIRMEMVDHVASDIEERMEAGDTRGFYNVFKGYMVENKAQLLKDNKQFLKSADKKIWKALVKEFFSPVAPILLIVFCTAFYLLSQNYGIEVLKWFVSVIPLIGLLGFMVTYIIYQSIKSLKRFSVVERLAFPFYAFYQLPNLFFNFSRKAEGTNTMIWLIASVSIGLTLIALLIIVSVKLFKSYEKQYKSLA
ncbi:hypothetical protein [Winogradskyella helgolandensis]|uniref:hypothetical protein n=1 Tax=Winogradskyella helgolandensis TaxID=2697010 RepID=UPI0015BA197F|nr:hypothetical protein [Winogradskyella helgolandensis]